MHTLPSHPPVWHRRNHSKFVFYAAKWKVFLPSLSTRWCLLRKVRVRQSSWTRYSRQWGAKLFANSINNNKNESFWSRFPPLGCCWLVIAQWIIYYSIKLWKIVERMLFQCLMRSRPPIHFFFSSGQANGCEFNCRLRCVARVELKWKNILWTTPNADYILRVHSFTGVSAFLTVFCATLNWPIRFCRLHNSESGN